MCSVILINNSQENADKDIHANDCEDDKKQRKPIIPIISWNPKNKNIL